MNRLRLSAACTVALPTLTGCSDDDSPEDRATKAVSQACDDLGQLRTDTAALNGLDPATTTKDQIEDAYEDVRDDWDEVRDDLGDLDDARRTALQDAADDLEKAYDDLPGGTTGRQALSRLQPSVDKLGQAVTGAFSGLECS
ncbi:hypothetical protein [Streptomyces sp. cmx-10-25]|uniref:hypothetical protein n=1 Tax=Streptomyces sp. cmx-10-25 TaxID=2790919 RepID=UPI00397F5F78